VPARKGLRQTGVNRTRRSAVHQDGLPGPRPRQSGLTADAQALNQVLVSFRVPALEIFQEASTHGHHHQQTAPGVVILLIRLEMVPKLEDALAQNCNLNLWRTDIGGVNPILRYDVLLRGRRQCHARKNTPRLTLISFYRSQDTTKHKG
jgi:hypothetical protein